MKNLTLTSFWMLLVLSVTLSCERFSNEIPAFDDLEFQSHSSIEKNERFFVTSSDVKALLSAREHGRTTKSGNNGNSVFPIVSDANDTLLYVVNYEDGWEILSSDKRTPAILAHSDYGSFSGNNANRMAWIQLMAKDIAAVRASADSELVFSGEEIKTNLAFWENPTPYDSTRIKDPANGHYELYSMNTTYSFYDEIDHMMQTEWAQESPYNLYCPYRSDIEYPSDYDRAPAGCSPVAAAQVLYYLQRQNGVPNGFYTTAICTGTVDSFSQTFGGFSSSTWDQMSTSYGEDDNHYVAILIANAGSVMNGHYNNTSSGSMINHYTDFFSVYGYNCSHSSYDQAVLIQSLLGGQPVIIDALDSDPSDIIDYFQGHSFVIDGFRRERQETDCVYRWVDDNTNMYDNSTHPDIFDHFTGAPYVYRVKMNWGWASQWTSYYDHYNHLHSHENDGWYALTGDWTTTVGSYGRRVSMYYGFTLNQ